MDYYSFTDPWRMVGWVGHVGWPIADGLTTKWSPVQLAVWRRIGKVRRPRPAFLCYAAIHMSPITWVIKSSAIFNVLRLSVIIELSSLLQITFLTPRSMINMQSKNTTRCVTRHPFFSVVNCSEWSRSKLIQNWCFPAVFAYQISKQLSIGSQHLWKQCSITENFGRRVIVWRACHGLRGPQLDRHIFRPAVWRP